MAFAGKKQSEDKTTDLETYVDELLQQVFETNPDELNGI